MGQKTSNGTSIHLPQRDENMSIKQKTRPDVHTLHIIERETAQMPFNKARG